MRGVPCVALATATGFAALAWLLSAAPASAGTVEAITDGGFEATTCAQVVNEWGVEVTACENPNWEESGSQAMPCLESGCRPDGARTGTGYGVLGGGPTSVDSDYSGALTQAVTLPAGGSKLLDFSLVGFDDAPGAIQGFDHGYTVGNFAVSIDGNDLFTTTATDAPTAWEDGSVDLHGYSGKHTIGFRTDCTRVFPPKPTWIFPCDEFDIDDVSLQVTPDPIAARFIHTPKRVTRNRRVRFEFASDDPAASFECSRDGIGYGRCGSPDYFYAGPGRHRFEVRAVSGVSISDSVQWSWRVKRHKRSR